MQDFLECISTELYRSNSCIIKRLCFAFCLQLEVIWSADEPKQVCDPHFCPYGVMAEEAADLPSRQHSTRVRVLIARHHLYPQRLQLRCVQGPGREADIQIIKKVIHRRTE